MLYLHQNGNIVFGAFESETLLRAVVKYGRAIQHTAGMYHRLFQLKEAFDFEVSVNETDAPTTPLEHYYIANELTRLGVRFTSLAPRFIGRFEKGVDYIGDLAALDAEMARRATVTEPALFERIWALGLERYPADRATYHVSADVERVPSGLGLPTLLDDFHAREILHVTFGSAMEAMRRLAERSPSPSLTNVAMLLESFLRAGSGQYARVVSEAAVQIQRVICFGFCEDWWESDGDEFIGGSRANEVETENRQLQHVHICDIIANMHKETR